MNDNWFGVMTVDNIEDIVGKLRELLTGKRYTFVSCYEYKRYEPEVRASQELKNGTSDDPFHVWYGENQEFGGFNVGDTYGVWGLDTNGHRGANYDGKFDIPYLVFDYGKCTMTFRTPAGLLAYWVVAVECE